MSRWIAGFVLLLSICQLSFAEQNTQTFLTQKDFSHGTYIIDQPGIYILKEDISFNPNNAAQLGLDAYQASFPLRTQFAPRGPYDPKAFGLGFFTAILITANDVILDLNGHRLEQSKEHALLQRFYSNIELADQPFLPKQGPADFGSSLQAAQHVIIRNGIIGRASHHGIHGNNNRNIWVDHVKFEDFEVAAIALNGVKGLKVTHVTATNRKDVPVIGIFSSAQFIKPYIEYLYRKKSKVKLYVKGKALTITEIRNNLRRAINNVHQDLIINKQSSIAKLEHPMEYALFHNPEAVIDGNSYGFLINREGFAVEGFPHRPKDSKNFAKDIEFDHVGVNNILSEVREVVAMQNPAGDAILDAVGSVFQLKNSDKNNKLLTLTSSTDQAKYKGNVVANAQAFVAKAILAGEFKGSKLDTSRSNIDAHLLRWIEKQQPLRALKKGYQFVCNCDSMLHVNKGVMAFRIDGAQNVLLRNTSINRIKNLGLAGSKLCGRYLKYKSHPKATLQGYGGSVVRGYSFAGSENVMMVNAKIDGLRSANGLVCGIDVFTDSHNFRLRNIEINHVWAGLDFSRSQIDPTAPPKAVGIHFGKHTKNVSLGIHDIKNLYAFKRTIKIENEIK